MGIEFHCNHCGKLIRAPRDAGGRRGKCPSCKSEVYVPMAEEDLETLSIAPLDEEDEKRQHEMDVQARKAAAQLLRERAPTKESGKPSADTVMADSEPGQSAESIDITGLVIKFVTAMAASKLDVTENIVSKLKPRAIEAKNEVARLMMDDLPPAGLESLPPALYKGFLKALLDRL